jgi:hypothetical protein
MVSDRTFSLIEAVRELKESVSALAVTVDALAQRVDAGAANDNAVARSPRRSVPKAEWLEVPVRSTPEARAVARSAVAKRFAGGR